MDKVEKYKQAVRKVIERVADLRNNAKDATKGITIIDDSRGHYLLYVNEWKGDKRSYGCYLHIDVFEDGKVWLQYDGTDLIIGQELLDDGVEKEDLVLGWIAPFRRADTEYAVG